jgi:hypothetical protein
MLAFCCRAGRYAAFLFPPSECPAQLAVLSHCHVISLAPTHCYLIIASSVSEQVELNFFIEHFRLAGRGFVKGTSGFLRRMTL